MFTNYLFKVASFRTLKLNRTEFWSQTPFGTEFYMSHMISIRFTSSKATYSFEKVWSVSSRDVSSKYSRLVIQCYLTNLSGRSMKSLTRWPNRCKILDPLKRQPKSEADDKRDHLNQNRINHYRIVLPPQYLFHRKFLLAVIPSPLKHLIVYQYNKQNSTETFKTLLTMSWRIVEGLLVTATSKNLTEGVWSGKISEKWRAWSIEERPKKYPKDTIPNSVRFDNNWNNFVNVNARKVDKAKISSLTKTDY